MIIQTKKNKSARIRNFIMETTIDEHEISQFNVPNQDWWDEKGSFSSLHKITPCNLNSLV